MRERDAPGASGTHRLLLFEVEGSGPAGALYPADAGPWSMPVRLFGLDRHQELPRIAPGALVEVDGDLDQRGWVVRAGDVVVVPRRTDATWASSMRIFAERGDVLVHPATGGHRPTWRHSPTRSTTAIARWGGVVRSDLRRTRWRLALLVPLTILVVAGTLARGRPSVSLWLLLGPGVGVSAAWAAWRVARGASRALRRARERRAGTIRPVLVRLWWSAGHGHGPEAVVSLWDAGHRDAGPVAEVPVVNVPDGFEAPEPVPGEARGDVEPGGAPVVRVGGVELWPAGPSRAPTTTAAGAPA